MNKKLFRTCRWMLVAAVAVQLTGCARHRTWLSSGLQQQKTWMANFPLVVEDTPVVARTFEPKPADLAICDDSKKTPELLQKSPGLLDVTDDHLEGDIVQSSGQGDQKQGGSRTQVQKVSSKAEADDELADLADWENDGENAARPAVIKQSTTTKKVVRTPEPLQQHLEILRNDPAPVTAVGSTSRKSCDGDLLSLCPDAKGDLRDQIHALDTTDVEVLKHRLGRLGNDVAAAPALEQLLKHKDVYVRMHAAFALARMQKSTPEGMRIVVGGLKAKDTGLRSFAAATIAEMGPQIGVALEAFAESLESRDRDGNYRFEDAEVLIRVRPKRQDANSPSTAKAPVSEKVNSAPAQYRIVDAVEQAEVAEPEQKVVEVVEEVMESEDETAKVDEEKIELEEDSTIVKPRIQRTSGTSE